MSEHGFSIYEIAGKLAGSTVSKAPERDLTADVDALLALVTPQHENGVSGQSEQPDRHAAAACEMLRLRDCLPEDVLLVIDAAYAEYVERPDYDPGWRWWMPAKIP